MDRYISIPMTGMAISALGRLADLVVGLDADPPPALPPEDPIESLRVERPTTSGDPG